jgi:hypothetical protein
MFIARREKTRDPAPEERNILWQAREKHVAPPELRKIFFESVIYKHFVPLGLGKKLCQKNKNLRTCYSDGPEVTQRNQDL